MPGYPRFLPPQSLAARRPSEWRPAEADRYREWLLGALPGRTDAVLRFLAMPPESKPAEELAVAGRRAAEMLHEAAFASRVDGAWKLTDAGYALAADLGLLVARRLLERHPSTLRWETVHRPKRDSAYHLPVLVGFTTGLYLEPVGGSIAEVHAVLRGTRGPEAWQRVFMFWSARAQV